MGTGGTSGGVSHRTELQVGWMILAGEKETHRVQ